MMPRNVSALLPDFAGNSPPLLSQRKTDQRVLCLLVKFLYRRSEACPTRRNAEERMNTARYPPRAVTLRHAIALHPKSILLSFTFLGCLLAASVLTIHEAYGLTAF